MSVEGVSAIVAHDQAGLAGADGGAALGRWYVLHTRSRQEKAVAEALRGAGVECRLPLAKKTRFYGHRKRVVREPLFSCYLFMRGGDEARYVAIDSGRVANVIPVLDEARFEHELAQVQRALDVGAEFYAQALTTGMDVRVVRGPLRGVEGRVDWQRYPNRLALVVQTLGRATSVEIAADLVEPVR